MKKTGFQVCMLYDAVKMSQNSQKDAAYLVYASPKADTASKSWELIFKRYPDNAYWLIRHLTREKYLGLDGNAEQGTKLIATDEQFGWHIWPDYKEVTAGRSFTLLSLLWYFIHDKYL